MRIAICDDESIHRNNCRTALTSCNILSEDAVITECSSGEELIDAHAECPFDIIFLDIQMGGISGLEAGHILRKSDKDVIIIYLTSHDQYVFNSFEIAPFDYILKSVHNNKICVILDRAVRTFKEQRHVVHFSWHDKLYALKVCEIVYLESEVRHVMFVTKNDRYTCIGKLSDYEQRLLSYGFLRCHQSFLINMGFIKSIGSKSILTTMGSEIRMSPGRKQYCLNTFSDHLVKYRV